MTGGILISYNFKNLFDEFITMVALLVDDVMRGSAYIDAWNDMCYKP